MLALWPSLWPWLVLCFVLFCFGHSYQNKLKDQWRLRWKLMLVPWPLTLILHLDLDLWPWPSTLTLNFDLDFPLWPFHFDFSPWPSTLTFHLDLRPWSSTLTFHLDLRVIMSPFKCLCREQIHSVYFYLFSFLPSSSSPPLRQIK